MAKNKDNRTVTINYKISRKVLSGVLDLFVCLFV